MACSNSVAGRSPLLGIALTFLFAATFIHQPPAHCPTALSRLDLLHAICSGTFQVDAYDHTPDKARYAGHFYSDKAPGTVVLALPAFGASAVLLKAAGVALESPQGWLISSWVACAGSVALVAALRAALLFSWLSNCVTARSALITTLALFLGAAPLPYATMMFSHSLVVGLICLALWALDKSALPEETTEYTDHTERAPSPGLQGRLTPETRGVPHAVSPLLRVFSVFRGSKWELLAGLACGWVLASEYTAGLVILGVFLWFISHGWRRAIPFCLAAIPPLLLIPLYSFLCFENPFILPYSLNESFPAMKEGLYAIKWPDAETAYNLLFSPTRGLFFWTPFLFMAGAGYLQLAKSDMRLFWLTYAVPLLQVVVISGRVWDWQAGPTLGPRYLAPILPLLALPCALGVQRFPRIGMALAAYSILITTLATLTNASPPSSYYNPLTELHITLLLKGQLAPNLGTALGLPPHASVAVYYALLAGGILWLWHRNRNAA